jgi:MOSC domain-containing protein YiiM
MSDAGILSVQTGRTAPLGPGEVPSAFVKTPRPGAVAVTRLGLEGDEQADLGVHGGPEKAVYGYAAARYPQWALEFPLLAQQFTPGAMGENLTISGLDEDAICVGDVHQAGSALLQVCQPRQPCYKFALRHGNKHLPKAMMRNGFSGWYYRVLRVGQLAAGDPVILYHRPNPDFAFARLIEIIYRGKATAEEIRRMAALEGLAGQWRDHARMRSQ